MTISCGFSRWSRYAVSIVRDALIFITAFMAVWALVRVRWPGVPIWPFVLTGAFLAILGSVWSPATKWIWRPVCYVVVVVWVLVTGIATVLVFSPLLIFTTLQLLPIRILRRASDRVVFVFFWTSASLGVWALAQTLWPEVPMWPFVLIGAMHGPVLIVVMRALLLILSPVVPEEFRNQVRTLLTDFL